MSMDPNTAMETIGAGAQAAKKFGEIIEKMLGPHWTRKQAEADAYADQKKLEIIRKNPDMEITYINGQLTARFCKPEELAYRADQRIRIEALRQEQNLERILKITDCELSQSQNISDAPVDDDWVTRFFSIAKDISNEEMQYIWGKILAGEIASPKSFSLRTLDTLKNISVEDAQIFQKIVPLIMCSGEVYFVISKTEALSKYKVQFADFLALDECGLVNSSDVSLTFQVRKDENKIIFNDKQLIAIRGCREENEEVIIGIRTLTKVGKELYKILLPSSSEEYVEEVAKHIYEPYQGKIVVSVHTIISFEGNGKILNYEDIPIVSYEKKS